jgi:hypothetical protein
MNTIVKKVHATGCIEDLNLRAGSCVSPPCYTSWERPNESASILIGIDQSVENISCIALGKKNCL